jgi:type IV pilus assembly protein PilV
MKLTHRSRQRQSGASLIEVLVTLVILMLGLLGLVGLMVQSQRSQMESYQRVQALVALEDMVNRINTNRKVAGCYAFTTAANGTPYLGTGATPAPACTLGTAEQRARAVADLNEWHGLLLGSGEQAGGSNVGGMLGARGCVQLLSAGVYQISVVWQGNGKTAAPAGVSCGTGLYGDETQRRAVSVNLQIASLS